MTGKSVPGYSTAEVARLLGVSPRQVRGWVHAGFLAPRRGPRGAFRYTFQDLVLLRAAEELAAARISPQRVRRALAGLQESLPAGRPLSAVRIAAVGERIVVRDGAETWEPESGQLSLEFDVADLAARAAPLARRAAREAELRADDLDAEDWFELGFELEATAPEEARSAYERAVAIDPAYADAHLNLGRLLHEEGAVRQAERAYRRAVEAAPTDPLAVFNLGVALQDLGRFSEAVPAYRCAIGLDPALADAYFNLAAVYEELGRGAEAIGTLKTYRALVGGGRSE